MEFSSLNLLDFKRTIIVDSWISNGTTLCVGSLLIMNSSVWPFVILWMAKLNWKSINVGSYLRGYKLTVVNQCTMYYFGRTNGRNSAAIDRFLKKLYAILCKTLRGIEWCPNLSWKTSTELCPFFPNIVHCATSRLWRIILLSGRSCYWCCWSWILWFMQQ